MQWNHANCFSVNLSTETIGILLHPHPENFQLFFSAIKLELRFADNYLTWGAVCLAVSQVFVCLWHIPGQTMPQYNSGSL